MSMELLPINGMSGQSYGYVVYRANLSEVPAGSVLTIGGRVCDSVVVRLNGELASEPLEDSSDLNDFGFWRTKNSNLTFTGRHLTNATLDLLVENWGRNNFGYLEQFNQFKGLWQGNIYLDGKEIMDWLIYPLEFKRSWIRSLSGWDLPSITRGPSLNRATFEVVTPADTYLDMRNWCKGIVIINDFVLGRYARIGPQQTLYLPKSLLKSGLNTVIVFEHYIPYSAIEFSAKPIFLTRNSKYRDDE